MRSFAPMDCVGRLAPASGIEMARFGFDCCAEAAATRREITSDKRMGHLNSQTCCLRPSHSPVRPQDAPRWLRERLSAGQIAIIYHPGIPGLPGIDRKSVV